MGLNLISVGHISDYEEEKLDTRSVYTVGLHSTGNMANMAASSRD